jgi:hypothetical protein
MIAGLCESPLTFQAIIIWRDELPNVPLQGLQDRPIGGNNGYSSTNENLLHPRCI